jgi:hypothetical protein
MNLLKDTARTSTLLLLNIDDHTTIFVFSFKQSTPLILTIEIQDDDEPPKDI